jgi:AcrR family transcriptional regulator
MSETELKEKILTESQMLFLRYGFKSITMDDIARELGVSKKTLYQYFTDKNELVDKCVDHHLQNTTCTCDRIMHEHDNAISVMIGITEFMGNMLRMLNPSALYDLKKYFKPSWDKLEANRREFIYRSIKQNIESGQRKGFYRKDINVDYTCMIYIHLVSMLIDPELYSPNVELRTLHLEIIRYHIRSICTPKGLEIFEEQFKQLNKKQ